MRNRQDRKKLQKHSVTKYSSDLSLFEWNVLVIEKKFGNSRPSASNFKSFSRSLEWFFLSRSEQFWKQNTISFAQWQINFLVWTECNKKIQPSKAGIDSTKRKSDMHFFELQINRWSLGDFTKMEGTQMEMFNFLWLILDHYLPLTPTKNDWPRRHPQGGCKFTQKANLLGKTMNTKVPWHL